MNLAFDSRSWLSLPEVPLLPLLFPFWLLFIHFTSPFTGSLLAFGRRPLALMAEVSQIITQPQLRQGCPGAATAYVRNNLQFEDRYTG